MDADQAISGFLEEGGNFSFVVNPFGVKLVDDYPSLRVGDHLPGYDPGAVFRKGTLPADKVVLVDPLPGTRLEIVPHPGPVHDIHHEDPVGGEGPGNIVQYLKVVGFLLKIPERVPENGDAVKQFVPDAEFSRVSLPELNQQPLLFGPLLGEADEMTGPVDPDDVLEAPSGEFQAVSSLSAAEVENEIVSDSSVLAMNS